MTNNNITGTVHLRRPFSFLVISLICLLLISSLIFYSIFGEINRKTKLIGLLAPVGGSLNIVASQSGVISRRHVAEGDVVEAGSVLFVINAEKQSWHQATDQDGGKGAITNVNALVSQHIENRRQTLLQERTQRKIQTDQRLKMLSDRIRGIEDQLRLNDEELNDLSHRVALSEKTFQRYSSLVKEGFFSESQAQVKYEELIDAQSRLRNARRNVSTLKLERSTLQGEQLSLQGQLQTDMQQIERSLASVQQEADEHSARQNSVVLTPAVGAPEKGKKYLVAATHLQVGQSVQSGQVVATLVNINDSDRPPAGPNQPAGHQYTLEAHLYATGQKIGFLKVGQTVFLRYLAYPYQKFGFHRGQITGISDTPFGLNEMPPSLASQLTSQTGSQEALYRINVRLDQQSIKTYGNDFPLKSGLTLEADVLQERRKIWEWIFEPVLAARVKLGSSFETPTQNTKEPGAAQPTP